MQIRVLGCSGSIAAGSRTTSFLVNGHVLIDAGTGVGDLALEELLRIDHVFVSHSHLDHVLAIGLLADSVGRRRSAAGRGPIRVYGLPATLLALRTHIFNNVIWPDFTVLPAPAQPWLVLNAIEVGQVLQVAEHHIEVLPAAHTVPAVGYAVREKADGNAWIYTGDTGPNPALWHRLAQLPVAALVIETAFGDDEQQVAEISQHLCPAMLETELMQLKQSADVYITHIKPGEVDKVMAEVRRHVSHHRVHALASGQVMAVG